MALAPSKMGAQSRKGKHHDSEPSASTRSGPAQHLAPTGAVRSAGGARPLRLGVRKRQRHHEPSRPDLPAIDSRAGGPAGTDDGRVQPDHLQSTRTTGRRRLHRQQPAAAIAVSGDAPSQALADLDAGLVAGEWHRRTAAEYRSAAIASQVTSWLIQVGAPPDLIRDGLQVVDDELTHSELSFEVAAAAGGPAPPVLESGDLTLPAPNGALVDLSLALVRFFCIGETVAVPMFRMLRKQATVPRCREVLDIVLRDEARHRQFGWDGLDWLLATHGPQVSTVVEAALPGMLDEVRQAYGGLGDGANSALPPEAQAWGLAPRSAYAATITLALTDDVAPRLQARGLPAAPAPSAAAVQTQSPR